MRWAMPNKWTFAIKPIKELLEEEIVDGTNINKAWADPFAGMLGSNYSFYTNDIDKNMPAKEHRDALEFLSEFRDDSLSGVVYDPPYSITQARQYEKKEYASMKYWADCKNEIARIIKPGGKAICFGWNSMGLGKNRGFEMTKILLIPHGGSRNDTIATVEIKLKHERKKDKTNP